MEFLIYIIKSKKVTTYSPIKRSEHLKENTFGRFLCLIGSIVKKKGGRSMSIGKTRSFLYKLAKLLGDVSAISSGSGSKIAKRVGRRTVGKITGRGIGKLFK